MSFFLEFVEMLRAKQRVYMTTGGQGWGVDFYDATNASYPGLDVSRHSISWSRECLDNFHFAWSLQLAAKYDLSVTRPLV